MEEEAEEEVAVGAEEAAEIKVKETKAAAETKVIKIMVVAVVAETKVKETKAAVAEIKAAAARGKDNSRSGATVAVVNV